MPERHLLVFDLDGLLVRRTEAGELVRTAGSWELLSQLQHRTDAVSTLATPSSEDDARAKVGEVSGVGLERYLDPDVGAYGSDSTDRSELVALARRRAHDSYGCPFTVMVVTRDSAADVAQTRRAADVVVAVGSDGAAAEHELRTAGADHVVASLIELVPLVRGAGVQ